MQNTIAAITSNLLTVLAQISGFLSQGDVAERAKREAAAQAEKSRLEGYLEAACRREEGLNADLTQAHAQVTQLTADVKQLTSEVRLNRTMHDLRLWVIRQHWEWVPGVGLMELQGGMEDIFRSRILSSHLDL